MSLAVRHPPTAIPALAKACARERWLALACSLAVAASYVLIAGLDGALGVPRNDDWGYYRTAFDVLHQGWFAPDPFTRTMLVGQVLLAQPILAVFGTTILPLQVFGAVLAAVGLWACYLVVRHFLPIGWAAFSVACLALGPIYGALAPTFMSDGWSFALQSLALLAGVRALTMHRRPLAWLGLSLALAFAAFSVREYAVAAPVAVLGCFLLSRGLLRRRRGQGTDAARVRRERVGAVALGLAWLLCAGTLYVWRAQLDRSRCSAHHALDCPWPHRRPRRVHLRSPDRAGGAALLAMASHTVDVAPMGGAGDGPGARRAPRLHQLQPHPDR